MTLRSLPFSLLELLQLLRLYPIINQNENKIERGRWILGN